MSRTAAGLKKTFPLDADVLGDGSALSLELTATSDADVEMAVVANTPFPTRPNGVIDLAHLGLTISGDKPIAFTAGKTTVGFSFSAGVTAGVGIFDDARMALDSLDLGETPGLDLTLASPGAGTRYAVLRAGYTAEGSVTGSHPVGGLGSLSFGVSGKASGLSAVIHRFPAGTGAQTVLADTVQSWKLPRHAVNADRLKPATWVLAEADGSLAVRVAASLGYNFNFVREAKVLGLSGDIGLKIDAAATATFGFSVSGRYLVVLGREAEKTTSRDLRLRLFKLSSHGLNFGLNLKVGVTGVASILPDQVDDFVEAVFGVHGSQVVKGLQQLEKWTDPSQSVGQLVAGLTNQRALDLLKTATGIDPATAFNDARTKFLKAINLWEQLPQRVSAELWDSLTELDAPATRTLQESLALLTSTDAQTQRDALLNILKTNHVDSTPIGRLVTALADRGILALLDRLPEVRQTAGLVQSVLDGGVIAKLQKSLTEALNLQKVIDTAKATDFAALDSFLVGRLSAFFDKDLKFEDLKTIKDTINMVIGKRKEIYDKARTALNSRYGLELAATWSKTTSSSAVLDVVFDTSKAEGQALLKAVLLDSDFDQILTSQSKALTVNAAVLTHEINRKQSLDVSLPYFSFQRESFNDAISTVEEDSSRVLLYNARGTDAVKVKNKFNSSLSVTFAAAVTRASASALPDLRVHADDSATWSYQLLHARPDMGREEIESFTRPFILQYMKDQFNGETNLSNWYNQFDRTVENILHNGPDEFGDVCTSYEVTIPGSALGAWARPVSDVSATAKHVSLAIQQSLKRIVPFYFFQDIDRLDAAAGCDAVLTWSALRPTTNCRLDSGRLIFDEGTNVFWNHPDVSIRRAMVNNRVTSQNLAAMLPGLRLRLEEAGRQTVADRFDADQVAPILTTASSGMGDIFLSSLLFFEAQIVEKAVEAFRDIQGFVSLATTSPSRAIERLAEFAADITTAFNKLATNSVFGGLVLRGLNQMVLVEASRALDGGLAVQPRALLTISVLSPKADRTFDIGTFINGALPPDTDVAVAQRLVSL